MSVQPQHMSTTPRPKQRVTIAGSFGFGNAGDEGAPLALADLAASIGVDLCVDLLGRYESPAEAGVIGLGADDAARRSPLAQQPLLYVGGGIIEPRKQAGLSRIGEWARSAKVGFQSLFGASVEPRVRYNWRARRRLAAELEPLRHLFVRDVVSATQLSMIAPQADVEVIGDVLLWLEPGELPAELRQLGRYVAVNLAPRWSTAPGWRSWIAGELAQVSNEFDAPIVFVPCTQRFDRDQDEHAAVANMLADAGAVHRAVCIGDGYEPRVIAAMLGGAQLVIGMRLHACVLAYAQSVPWVGLAYHPKLSGFAATVEQPARLLPQHLPTRQSSDAYGFAFSALELADCDLVHAARQALDESSFHQLQPLRDVLAESFRGVLEEAASVTLPVAGSENR